MRLPLFFTISNLLETLRYLLASLVALTIDSALLFTLHYVFKIPIVPATIIGFSTGILVIYYLSITQVFSYRRIENVPLKEIVLFWLSGAVGLLLTVFSIWMLSDHFDFSLFYAKTITAGFVFVFNYVFRKLYLFTDWSQISTHQAGKN